MFSLISDQTFIFQRLHWNQHQAEVTQAELTQGRLDSRADLPSPATQDKNPITGPVAITGTIALLSFLFHNKTTSYLKSVVFHFFLT